MRVAVAGGADARAAPEGPRAPSALAFVSVVIPAYNAAEVLPVCLASVLRQDYPAYEVIVVNDGSADRTAESLSAFRDARLRVLAHRRNLGLAASLNDGLRCARGELVLFLHADCELVSPTYLRQAAAHFVEPRVAWISGNHESLGLVGGNLIERIFAALRFQTGRDLAPTTLPVAFAEGKCDMIRRRALDEVGGVPRDTRWSGEDQLLSYALRRAGYPILKDGALLVRQHCGAQRWLRSLRLNLRKEFAHGKTQAWINLRYFRTVLSDLFAVRLATGDRTRAALSRLLYGGGALALLGAYVARRQRVVAGLAAAVVLGSVAGTMRRMREAGLRLTAWEVLAAALVGLAASITYTCGLLWGAAAVTPRGRRPARPL